jgi:hypothetical protein
MTLKINNLLMAIVVFTAFQNCRNTKQANPNFDIVAAKKMFHNNENIMLLPCVACGCFKPALEDAYKKDSIFFNSVYFVTDSTCSKFPFSNAHISQRRLDSLSDEFYNVTLIKFEGDKYKVRIINSDENGNLLKIAKSFFN